MQSVHLFNELSLRKAVGKVYLCDGRATQNVVVALVVRQDETIYFVFSNNQDKCITVAVIYIKYQIL